MDIYNSKFIKIKITFIYLQVTKQFSYFFVFSFQKIFFFFINFDEILFISFRDIYENQY